MRWTKRIPIDMLSDYTSRGWRMLKMEGRTVVLVWDRAGAPE